MQVLRNLHDCHALPLLGDMRPALDPAAAVSLPQDLLARWVAAQAPVLNVRNVVLSQRQMVHLVRGICEARLGRLSELHIPAVAGTAKKELFAANSHCGGKLDTPRSEQELAIVEKVHDFCSKSAKRSLICQACELRDLKYGACRDVSARKFASLPSAMSVAFLCPYSCPNGISWPESAPVELVHIYKPGSWRRTLQLSGSCVTSV